jgi:nucleoside-diphosphate-sugar epimerase
MKKKSEVSGAKVRPMVVVTGVSGLIGSALVDELARD